MCISTSRPRRSTAQKDRVPGLPKFTSHPRRRLYQMPFPPPSATPSPTYVRRSHPAKPHSTINPAAVRSPAASPALPPAPVPHSSSLKPNRKSGSTAAAVSHSYQLSRRPQGKRSASHRHPGAFKSCSIWLRRFAIGIFSPIPSSSLRYFPASEIIATN